MFNLVGYFVVGTGKFGTYEYGSQFVLSNDDPYWTDRGYEFVAVYVKE